MLTVPDGYKFVPIKSILMAFKSGIVKKRASLKPLQFIVENFKAKVDILLVKTPNYTEEDMQLDKAVDKLKSSLTITENATTFQGVLEHINSFNSGLLCVFRRKRGFFMKLWEKSTILKSEFYTNVPLLIIKGK